MSARVRLILTLAFICGTRTFTGRCRQGTSCADLTALTIPDVAITSSTSVPAGPFAMPGGRPGAAPTTIPAFCRVVAVGTPSSDSHINFEVWIPEGRWLERQVPGRGHRRILRRHQLFDARGWHAPRVHDGRDRRGAHGRRSGIRERASGEDRRLGLSVHSSHDRTGKLIVRSNTGRFPDRSYFNGCATGGHQAMMEVQRFPADYDGVVAGNPAADRTNEIIAYLWDWLATHGPDGKSLVAPGKFQLLTKSAVAACDADDGVKDGVIDDPRRCRFDPASLLCKGADSASCLDAV